MALSSDERDRRYQAIRAMMEEKDLFLLLVASNAMWTGHVRYFSAYPPHFGPAYLLFPRQGTPTQFVFSKIQEQVASRGWVADSRQSSNFSRDIAQRIKELDSRKRIGLVGVENISFQLYAFLRRELAPVTFVDVTQEIFALRMIKSAEEQDLSRKSAQIADALFGRVKEVAQAGQSEFDLYAEMDYFIRKQGVESAFNLIASGRFPVAPFLSPSERILAHGDSVLVELTPRYQGYYTQLTVVHPLEQANPKLKAFLDLAFAAQKAGLEFLKPGNRACDVARAMKEVIEKEGYAMPYRGGHSMGHEVDEPPAITPEDETPIQAGMTIVVHPCVMDKNGDGVFIGDSYLVTESGWERLNKTFPQ